jgi:hypothetical protein
MPTGRSPAQPRRQREPKSPRDESSAAEAAFEWDPPVADEGPGAPFVWPRPEPVQLPPRKPRCTQPELPRIECDDRQFCDVTADAGAALVAANPPPWWSRREVRGVYQDRREAA